MTKTKIQRWQRFFMWIGVMTVVVVFLTVVYQAGRQSVGSDPIRVEAPKIKKHVAKEKEDDSDERSRRRERDKDWDLNP